jgi:high-affinity iron transporter
MRAFTELSEQQRWGLAFYVGQLSANRDDLQAGAGVLSVSSGLRFGLQEVTTLSPAEAEAAAGEQGRQRLLYLRSHPEALFEDHVTSLAYAREMLASSLQAYRQGQMDSAGQLALQAYLEGFELVEGAMGAVAPQLRGEIESGMNRYRLMLRDQAGIGALEQQVSQLQIQLQQASDRLGERNLTSGAAFSSALLILLREGLEAILVIAALGAFLLKSGRRDGMRYLHLGWIAALLAGGATWWVSAALIEISGAGRELTEAVAAVAAAVLLFYVGFWMHSKTQAAHWKHFIEQSIHKALGASTLWSLALLSFITVYREAFETILFFQSLWVQADTAAQSMIVSGFVSGSLALVVLAWLIMRYSVRLPLRQFFVASGVLMFVLAVIFAGKGVAALMEAGWLPLAPIDIPTISLLGIYPNLTGLMVQSLMVALALVLLLRGSSRKVVEAAE